MDGHFRAVFVDRAIVGDAGYHPIRTTPSRRLLPSVRCPDRPSRRTRRRAPSGGSATRRNSGRSRSCRRRSGPPRSPRAVRRSAPLSVRAPPAGTRWHSDCLPGPDRSGPVGLLSPPPPQPIAAISIVVQGYHARSRPHLLSAPHVAPPCSAPLGGAVSGSWVTSLVRW